VRRLLEIPQEAVEARLLERTIPATGGKEELRLDLRGKCPASNAIPAWSMTMRIITMARIQSIDAMRRDGGREATSAVTQTAG
jgi:hypothetical protein